MTAPESQAPALDTEPSMTDTERPEAPPPEPWTPERVLEWNRYYDIYVAAGALLLVLLASIHPVSDASFWSDLQTGRLIAARGPVTSDPFSYTMAGSRWVDVPWLYQAAQAKIFDLGTRFGAANPEQAGTTAAILLNAFLRMLTALVLFQIRRRGPGAWWIAICVVLGFGGILMPYSGGTESLLLPILGGLAGPASLNSTTWGILLLAVEMWLIFRASRGSRAALVGLLPLFLIWANVDDSFLIGLILLALRAVASPLERTTDDAGERRVAPAWWFGALVGSAAVTLANPWFWEIYPVAATPLLRLFGPSVDVLTYDQLSFFGPRSWEFFNRELGAEGGYRLYVAYYVIVVGVGLASFVLNRRRFSLGRLLVYLVAAALWGALMTAMAAVFAVVFVATLGLNGQEWYRDRFGVEGRLGTGWALWSVGGRAVTLILIFAFVFKGLTGKWASAGEPVFGVGMNADEFAFEASEFLGKAPIDGHVLNFQLAQGDALIWKAWPLNPLRKTYIDGRPHLFPRRLQEQLRDLRRAFADGRREDWQPVLDELGVSVLMVPMLGDPYGTGATYAGLATSPDWIPFYDDGGVVLFGRADASTEDVAFFRENRLDPKLLAFRTGHSVPSSDQIPTPTSWVDRIFENKGRKMPQPHVFAAQRWLTIRNENQNETPTLANCLLAIGEARAALAIDPDDAAAWNVLGEAYRLLAVRESQVFADAGTTGLPSDYLEMRIQQRATVLNFAIQSTPPPTTLDARIVLATLHQELSDVYLTRGYLDLARDHLASARELLGPEGFSEPLEVTLAQLDEQIAQLEAQLSEIASQQANPLQLAQFALESGAPGLAIKYFDEAESAGINPDAVKAQLLDLYCQTGKLSEAIDIISQGNVEDPALSTGPGSASYRQGLVYFLIGSYDLAATLWRERALPQLRGTMVFNTLEAVRSLLRGLPREASDTLLEAPDRLATEALWETRLGFCLLESGNPREAAEHFVAALRLQPRLAAAPLLRVYLEEIGVEAPEVVAPEESKPVSGADATGSSETAPVTPEPAVEPSTPDAAAADALPDATAAASDPDASTDDEATSVPQPD